MPRGHGQHAVYKTVKNGSSWVAVKVAGPMPKKHALKRQRQLLEEDRSEIQVYYVLNTVSGKITV